MAAKKSGTPTPRTKVTFANGRVILSNHALIAKVKRAATKAKPVKTAKTTEKVKPAGPGEQTVSALVTFTNSFTSKAASKASHTKDHCDMIVDIRC